MKAFLLLTAVFCTACLPLGCASGSSSRRTVEAESPPGAVWADASVTESQPAATAEIDVAAARNAAQLFLFDNHLTGQPFELQCGRENGDWVFFETPSGFVRPNGEYVSYNVSLAGVYLLISPQGTTRIDTTEPGYEAPGPVNWCGLQDDLRAAMFIGRAAAESARISCYEFVRELDLGDKGWLFQVINCWHHDPGEPTPDCEQSVVFVNRQGECSLVFTSP